MAKTNGDFVKVAETKDIQSREMKAVEVAGEKICLINVQGKYYAIGNVCTHEGGPLTLTSVHNIYNNNLLRYG